MFRHTYSEYLDRNEEQLRIEAQKLAALQDMTAHLAAISRRLAELNLHVVALTAANDSSRRSGSTF